MKQYTYIVSAFSILVTVCLVNCQDVDHVQEIADLRKELRELKQAFHGKIETLEATIEKREEAFVGFSAYASYERWYGVGSIVLYDIENLDAGGGFDTNTGIFTCPVSGFYHFSVTTFTGSGNHFSATLAHQNLEGTVTGFPGGFGDQNGDDQGSVSYVVRCLGGETVFVRQGSSGGGSQAGYLGHYGGPLNAFSGFLIHQFFP